MLRTFEVIAFVELTTTIVVAVIAACAFAVHLWEDVWDGFDLMVAIGVTALTFIVIALAMLLIWGLAQFVFGSSV